MQYIIFTDGASRGNPGPGGWGAVVIEKNGTDDGDWNVIEAGGRSEESTNNKMELKAAVQGLSLTPAGSEVILYTDSSYLRNGITKWVDGWKRNGWKTRAKEDVLNSELWLELDELNKARTVSWKYVSGHSGVSGNERCDEIATAFSDKIEMELYKGPLSKYNIQDILDVSHDPEKFSEKKKGSARSKAKAFSYVSSVAGKIEIHNSWAECEKRVKGVRGARYKKALSREEESEIVREWRKK